MGLFCNKYFICAYGLVLGITSRTNEILIEKTSTPSKPSPIVSLCEGFGTANPFHLGATPQKLFKRGIVIWSHIYRR